MDVTWTDSADEHEIPHNEALYAMSHPHHVVKAFGETDGRRRAADAVHRA